jgi:hypothetical protein
MSLIRILEVCTLKGAEDIPNRSLTSRISSSSSQAFDVCIYIYNGDAINIAANYMQLILQIA